MIKNLLSTFSLCAFAFASAAQSECAPFITYDLPQNVYMCDGETFTLAPAVVGDFLEYQWFEDNQPMDGQTGSSLSLVYTGGPDAVYTYFVQISNECGSVNSMTATVQFNTSFVNFAPSYVVCEGVNTAITGPSEIHEFNYISWYKDGELYPWSSFPLMLSGNIEEAGVYQMGIFSNCGVYWSDLITVYVVPAETTTITASICQGEAYLVDGYTFNQEGEFTYETPTESGCPATTHLTLDVMPLPTLLETSLDQYLCIGNDITMFGYFSGTIVEYDWTLNGQEVFNTGLPELTLNEVIPQNSGVYVVTAYNECGGTNSAPINIFVEPTPEIIVVQDGNTLFAALGFENYEWYLDDILMGTGESIDIQESGVYTVWASSPSGCETSGAINAVYTSINEFSKKIVSVYPNPSNGLVRIDSPSKMSTIQVINSIGQVVKLIQSNALSASLDLRELPVGQYVLRCILDNGKVEFTRVIVSK